MPSDTADTWRRAQTILAELLELPAAARAERLAALEVEAAIKAQVAALLEAVELPDPRLDPPTDPFAMLPAGAPDDRHALRGRRVGAWELQDEIGRGGMSVVYRARRVGAGFDQVAALKLMSLAALGPQGRQRFERERHLLARLQHPQIAGLIDGGLAEDGTPFLVMSMIEGERIDRYCESQGLDLAARLRLLIAVCEAVAHAHRNLVIHRDIKPGNILVTAQGLPVLLDFGIAKLLDEDPDATTTSLQPMTPAYAAPEQASGLPSSTATDVFALGKVLERLLASMRPLPRDLRNILAMALHLDPARRYPDAASLGEDLCRFIEHRPVRATPDSAGYRTRAFLRRHRAGVAVAALVLILLLGGMGATLWQAQRAQAAAELATETRRFLVELLQGANRENSGDEDPRISRLVDLAGQRLELDAQLAPALRVDLLTLLGELDEALGRRAEARARLEAALALAQSLGNRALEASTRVRLGVLENSDGNAEAALAHLEWALANAPATGKGAIAIRRSTLPGIAHALYNLGRVDEALDRLRLALEEAPARHSTELRATLLSARATLQQPPEDRLAQLQEAIALRGQESGTAYSRMTDFASLAIAYEQLGRLQEAADAVRQAVALAETIYPGPHPRRVRLYSNLGTALNRIGQAQAAEAAFAQSEAMFRALGDESSPGFAALLNNRASLLIDLGRGAEAVPLLRQCADLARTAFGEADARTRSAHINLARAASEAGLHEEAEAAWVLAWRALKPEDPAIRRLHAMLTGAEAALAAGNIQAAQARRDQASATLAELDDQGEPTPEARVGFLRLHLLYAALAALQDDVEAAESYYRDAETEAESLRETFWARVWRMHLAIADFAVSQGDLPRPEAHRERARILYLERTGSEQPAGLLRPTIGG
jgi:eukaryotic-like serine/threonine-protein kinase